MNGALATTTCLVAGAGCAFATILARDGDGDGAIAALFALVAAIALVEVAALVRGPRLAVCALVATYAFLATFLVPVGPDARVRAHGAHDAHGGDVHATAR